MVSLFVISLYHCTTSTVPPVRKGGGCNWMSQTHVWVGQDYPGPPGLDAGDMNEE